MATAQRNPQQRLALCERKATKQLGLISREQAATIGLSASVLTRLVNSGRWARVLPGVYRLSTFPSSHKQKAMAACLWGGPGAVASHRTAAALWKFDVEPGSDIEILIPQGKRTRAPKGIRLRNRCLEKRDHTLLGCIPVTDVTRTLIDLGDVQSQEVVEVALEDALKRRSTDLERIGKRLRSLPSNAKGPSVLRRVLRLRGNAPAAESRLEVEVIQLLRNAGLPAPTRQHEIWKGERFVARVDFAYPDLQIAIEADGYEFHGRRRKRWSKDADVRNELQGMGWRVLVVTWERLKCNPERIVAQIEALLGIQRLKLD